MPRKTRIVVAGAVAGALGVVAAGMGAADAAAAPPPVAITMATPNVLAERYGTVGELRGELRDREPATRHTELREWLSS